MSLERRYDKAEIQAMALGVVVSWLLQESHLDGVDSERALGWIQEIQKKIADLVGKESLFLYAKSKTAPNELREAGRLAVLAGKLTAEDSRVDRQKGIVSRQSLRKSAPARGQIRPVSAIRVPPSLPKHPRVPSPKPVEVVWLSDNRSLKVVLGVVTNAGQIEMVYLRDCDPPAACSTFYFWRDEQRYSWRWTPETGVFCMDGKKIPPPLVRRIEAEIEEVMARTQSPSRKKAKRATASVGDASPRGTVP